MAASRAALLAADARRSVVRMCSSAKAAHVGSALSCIDILSVLYAGGSNAHPDQVSSPDRDIVIISKGHAAAAAYAVLGHAGFFPLEWLDEYCTDGGPLGGHVTKGRVPGVELSTGSLGHGLPFATGIALARARTGNPGRVFVVMSDGECDEGSNWEAALLAGHHRLSSLTVFIDRNGIQSLAGTEQTVRLEPLAAKWAAFGWAVFDVDGHDHEEIMEALRQAQAEVAPTVLICRTLKGKGVSFMENQILWHYRPPDEAELTAALAELTDAT